MTPSLGNDFWINSQLLAGCSGNYVKVWDPFRSGYANNEATISEGARANSVLWTTNNKALVFGGQNGTIALYCAGKYLGGVPHESSGGSPMPEVTCIRLSNDSRKIIAGCKDHQLFVWDTNTQVRHNLQ